MDPVAVTPIMSAAFMWFWMLGSGLVLPVGLPPGPEDPVAANVAPQECLFYLGWASMAKPDPKSPNQLEQLFAEPEIQQLVAQVECWVRDGLRKGWGGSPEAVGAAEDVVWLAKKGMSSPGAVYVRSLQWRGDRPPGIQAGAIVGLGDDAAKVRSLLEKYTQMAPPGQIETVKKVGGEPFYRIKLDAEAPVIAWGFHGSHFVIGVGDGEAEALVKRMDGKPPEWLAAVRKRLVVDRPATVSYLNVRKIVEFVRANAGPQAGPIMDALGLESFTSYAAVAGLDKDGYVSKSLLATRKAKADFLSFLGPKPLEAKDLAAIPRDATWACAARIDLDRLWQMIVAAVGKADPAAAEGLAQAVAREEQELKIKLREDLLQPLGGVWSVYNSPGEGGFVVTGLTVVGKLNDPKRAKETHDRLMTAFRGALDTMKVIASRPENREFHSLLGRFQCAGHDVYTLRFPFAPSWCLTDKELVIALFPQNVKAYLLRGPEYRSLAEHPEVAAALGPEPGPVAMSYVNQPELFRTFYPLVQLAFGAMAAPLRSQGIEVDPAILPSAPAINRHLRPGATVVRRTADGIETTNRQSLPGGNVSASAPFIVPSLLWYTGRATTDRATVTDRATEVPAPSKQPAR